MSQSSLRIVLDTNTLLRGLLAANSASAKVRRAAERREFVPLLSKPVLDEYRAVLTDDGLAERFPEFRPDLVEVTLRRLRFMSDYIRLPKAQFEYRRDTGDQKFIELAIALGATNIITHDNDLLSLPGSHLEAGRRFRQRLPACKVMTAAEFVEEYESRLS